jgi:hypothetical protein
MSKKNELGHLLLALVDIRRQINALGYTEIVLLLEQAESKIVQAMV